jgi:hypothetical protein
MGSVKCQKKISVTELKFEKVQMPSVRTFLAEGFDFTDVNSTLFLMLNLG